MQPILLQAIIYYRRVRSLHTEGGYHDDAAAAHDVERLVTGSACKAAPAYYATQRRRTFSRRYHIPCCGDKQESRPMHDGLATFFPQSFIFMRM